MHQLRSNAKANKLLAALPDDVWLRWAPKLELVELPLGKVLYEPGDTMAFVYFPTSAIVSLLYVTREGGSVEMALVGNEGVVGVSLFMGGQSTLGQGIVQRAGRAVRLRAQSMMEEFERGGPVTHLLLRYTQALMTQIAQLAVCNRHHTVDQQLCRLLLMSMDCTEGNELLMTHEATAHMLGVRRESVTAGALHLQEARLIQYARGHIQVLDRAGLEHRACECYGVVKNEYDRLLRPARSSHVSRIERTEHLYA